MYFFALLKINKIRNWIVYVTINTNVAKYIPLVLFEIKVVLNILFISFI